MRWLLVLLVAALGGQANAQSVKVPAEVSGRVGGWIIVPAEADGGLEWYTPDPGLSEVPLAALFGEEWAKKAKGKVFTAETAGRYRVLVWTAKDNVPSKAEVCTVVVGGVLPPSPPTPPGPVDPPVPPPQPPSPGPGTSPFPEPGFRALIVYDSANLSRLPPTQVSALRSLGIRAYLNARTVRGPDGKKAEWRILSIGTDMTQDSKTWQDAMARPRTTLPWIVIGDGKTGYEGPLPLTEAETLTLLQKYGG